MSAEQQNNAENESQVAKAKPANPPDREVAALKENLRTSWDVPE